MRWLALSHRLVVRIEFSPNVLFSFMESNITKVTSHISHNEALIFERSQPGRIGYRLPPLDVDEQPLNEILPKEFQRDDDLEGLPEVSEVDVIRHFIRMS